MTRSQLPAWARSVRVAGLIAMAAIAITLAGCTGASSRSPAASPQAAAQPTDAAGSLQPADAQPSQEPAGTPGTVSLPPSVIDPVVADIAQRAGVPVEEVVVQSAEPVTFPDGSLGCPQPGMAYTQVQVDGYRIVATAAGTTYDYRGTAPGAFQLCTPKK